MRSIKETSQFKSDKKRIKNSGRHQWQKLLDVVILLLNDSALPAKYRDHELLGNYAGVRECHVEPDWLLIYDKSGDVESGDLKLIRTGSHSSLF